MLEKQQLQILLDLCLAHGGDHAEIYEEKKMSQSISMLNGKVENSNCGITYGIGIRIFHDLESVYAYSNDTNMDNLTKMTNSLAESFMLERSHHAQKLKEVTYENAHPIQKAPKDVPIDQKLDLMRKASQAAQDHDEVIGKVQCVYMDEQQQVRISNSDGKLIEDTRTRMRLSVSAIAMLDGKMETGSCNKGGHIGFELWDEIDPADLGKEAARIAKTMLYADDCPSGTMPVIIDEGFGGVIFHEACGHSLEASSVAKNQSVFAGKLGQKIASDCVSAVDDGTIPNAWGSANIDDEGNFTKRNVLIENGILKSYMIDSLNGRRMGMESTGSSRRQSYKYQPTSRMTNTFILTGKDNLEDMIKETPYGLYAKSMAGGSVDPSTGDFNFAVMEGYLIKDGKIVKPVKGASLIGNGADTLLKIDRVGQNLSRAQGMCGASSGSIPTDVGQPAIRVSSMIVGGKESNHE